MGKSVLDWVIKVAEIPSFSSFEERLHPLIFRANKQIQASIKIIHTRNLLLTIPATAKGRPIALTAHLDKINHFGKDIKRKLKVQLSEQKLCGLLDDAVGVGILLYIGSIAHSFPHPPLYLLFSEMEESTGLKKTPHLLRNHGKRLKHGIGAQKLSAYLIKNQLFPQLFITIDTTPLFRGKPGIALYSRHWELNSIVPSKTLIRKTVQLENQIRKLYPSIQLYNNTNDYLEYGKQFAPFSIPSIALEPAIYPYHCANEEVYLNDIQDITDLLIRLINHYSLSKKQI
ncbi:MAG: hypothetical protein N2450_06195 [bacterium]|nr:hypothetical protein [bacterium]